MLILFYLKIFILISSAMDTNSQTTHRYDEQYYIQKEFMQLLDDSKQDFVSQGSDFVSSSIRNRTRVSLPPITLCQYCLLQTIWALSSGHLDLAKTFIMNTVPCYDTTSEEWLENFRFEPSFVYDSVKSTSKIEGDHILKQLALSLSRIYDVLITAAERGDDSLITWLKEAGLDLAQTGSKAITSAWIVDQIDTVNLLLELGAIDDNSAREVAHITNSRGETLLHLAARRGELLLVKKLLDAGAMVDQKDLDSLTPLYHAVRSNAKETVRLLLKRGADLHTRSKTGNTLLHLAVIEHSTDAVSGLLEQGLDIDVENYEGIPPFFLAAERGYDSLMDFLIKRGADANVKTSSGNALLLVAVNRRSLTAARYLIRHGASINSKNSEGLTPLYLAANGGSQDLIWFLLNKGAARHDSESGESLLHIAARRGDIKAIDSLVNLCIPVDEVDKNGLPPLYSAASTGKRAAMELLLFKGADLYITLNSGLRLLHAASIKGNVLAIGSLLDMGIYVDVKDTDVQTALCRAVQNDNIVSVALLIEKGANTSFRTTIGDTLLHIAAAYNSFESIHLLVELGLNIESENDHNETPLYIAVKNNNTKTANLLITLGANKNYVTSKGGTLAHLATSTNDFVALKTLINIGADFNVIDKDGFTPLFNAIRKSEMTTANIMLESGVDLFYVDLQNDTLIHIAGRNKDHSAIDFLIDRGVYIDSQGWTGSRPIDVALYNGNCNTAEYFVKKGANVRGRNKMNRTMLHSAVIGDCSSFLEHIASNEEIVDPKDQNMQTPLHLAAVLGKTVIAKTLILLGADVNSFDKNNMTPLQIAAVNRNWVMVSSFLKKDVNLNWTDAQGRTLLHLAALEFREELVKYLTEGMRVNIYVQDIEGRIPLHLAAEGGQPEIMRYLTDERVPGNIDYRDNEEKTPLHIAAISGHNSVVDYLLAKGANPKATDCYQQTPLMYAAKHHNWDIVRRLLSVVCGQSFTNDIDEEKRTILHLAVLDMEHGIVSTFTECLKKNMNNKDSKGQTPLDIALTMKNWNMVGIFINIYNSELNLKDCFSLRLANAGFWEYVGKLYQNEVSSKCRDLENRTLLHLAAWHANAPTLLYLLEISSKDLDARDLDDRTPLHLATIANRTDNVRILLEHGARKDIYDKDHIKPLTTALNNKDWGSVRQLLKNETDIHWSDNYNRTLLHYAATDGQHEIIDYLLENSKMDINAKDINLNTPLQLAVAQSNIFSYYRQKIINGLVSNGADWSTVDKEKRNLIHLVTISGDQETLQYILERYKLDINGQDINSQTPLHIAVIKGHYNMVNTLLKFKADRNEQDVNHFTPLVYAIKKRFDAMDLLDDSFEANWTDTYNRSILHLAAMHGCYGVAKKLLNHKLINIDPLDINGQTPLHFAAGENDGTIVDLLLWEGANGYDLDKENRTPLKLAVIKNSWNAVTKLSIRGYFVEDRYDRNRTLLHIAIMNGLSDLTEHLINNKITEITASDDDGDTPLHFAARKNDYITVQKLLNKRVDKGVMNGNGQSPLTVATVSKSWEVVDVLLKDNCDVEGVYENNRTLLHVAAMYGKKAIIDHLFSCRNVDINALDSNHETSLDLLFKYHSFSFAQAYSHINWRDGRGRTILHNAKSSYYYSHYTFIMIDAEDNEKQTPLHVASTKGDYDQITWLLDDGASANAVDINGHSPVHLAAMNGHTAVMEFFVSRDVKIYNLFGSYNPEKKLHLRLNARDLLGRTPLQLSIDNKHNEMTTLLKKHWAII